MSDRILETLQRIQNIQRLLRSAGALNRADSPPKPTTPPRPQGLHKLTYARLLRLREYLHEALALNPKRHLSSLQRRRADTQYRHRLARIDRRLAGGPLILPAKQWFRIGEAARILHVSRKTLIRWERAGLIKCAIERRGRSHRYFSRTELVRISRTRRL